MTGARPCGTVQHGQDPWETYPNSSPQERFSRRRLEFSKMALTKCKECGEQISTKAEACPKCGAKQPKKTSLLTWGVLAFIILVVIVQVTSHETPKGSGVNSASSGSSSSVVAEEPRWETSTDTDKMTSKQQFFATSPTINSTEPMASPYHDVKSWIGIGCDSKSQWVYFGFSTAPNLLNTETHDGYNGIRARIKWDGSIAVEELTQKWGAAFLHFDNAAHAISKLTTSKSVLLELDWYGQNKVYFEYPMTGATEAIKGLRANCMKK
jgi:RNA polymerase subunit RPABC4/transcription elongation factor Spt4